MKTHKQKIQRLNKILTEYVKYLQKYNYAKCYDVGLRFAVIFKNTKPTVLFDDFKRRFIPRDDIDIVIERYRSKLNYEIEKYNKNNTKVSQKGNILFFKLKMFD